MEVKKTVDSICEAVDHHHFLGSEKKKKREKKDLNKFENHFSTFKHCFFHFQNAFFISKNK